MTVYQVKIPSSERLSYQLVSENDSEFLYQLDQDPEVMRFINDGKMTTREEIKSVYIPRMKSYLNPTQGWGLWKVMDQLDSRPIGWVLVRPVDFFSEQPQYDNLELGWRFRRDYWGQGYASEAAVAISKQLISLAGKGKIEPIRSVSAIAKQENMGSIRIMEKLGMSYVKKGIHHDPLGDWDVVYYQLEIPVM